MNSSHAPVLLTYLEPLKLRTWIPAGVSNARYSTSKQLILIPAKRQTQQFLQLFQAILVCLHSTRRLSRRQSKCDLPDTTEVDMLWCNSSIRCTISWVIKPRLAGLILWSGWGTNADLSSRFFRVCTNESTFCITNSLDVLILSIKLQDRCSIRSRIQDVASRGHIMPAGAKKVKVCPIEACLELFCANPECPSRQKKWSFLGVYNTRKRTSKVSGLIFANLQRQVFVRWFRLIWLDLHCTLVLSHIQSNSACLCPRLVPLHLWPGTGSET